jgi:thiamine pyrophosphate-dependent acetolactate synthase large subunit-like protein
MNGDTRVGYVSWVHSVFDGPGLVRDFTKFDDTPASLPHFADSAARAYKFSMTPPYGPVVLALDEHLQEGPLPDGRAPALPKLPTTAPPQGEIGAVRETARMLVAAESPVILADRAARTPEGLRLMVDLAEALQAPVVDRYGRMNFPWRHPLNQSAVAAQRIADADVILGLEMTDFYGSTQRQMQPTAKRISISASDVYMGSNYQDFNRFTEVDLALAADAEATLPSLIEEVRRQTTANRRSAFRARGKWLATEHQAALRASREAAARGWNAQPITTARLCAELYNKIKNDDWSLVNGTIFQNFWPQQLWAADKHYQYIGDSGAYGLGYLPGASVGAALANKRHGRLTVAIGGDGDFMFAPGALWTAAHHQIPLLYIIHNNGGYHQEIMWIQHLAATRERGVKDRPRIGNVLDSPGIDFAKIAQGMGVHAEGPIRDPGDLGPALDRALAVVRAGQPALLDVVSQGR